MRKVIGIIVLFLLIFAERYWLPRYLFATAMEQYNAGNIKGAEENLHDSAARNHAESFVMLGKIEQSKRQPDSPQKAFAYFARGVELGARSGYAFLGDCYLSGSGVEKDEKKAVELYKKGVEANDPVAMNYYSIYFLMRDAPGDIAEALKYMEMSAELGYKSAQFNYGSALIEGTFGIACDPVRGAELLNKSAAQNFPPAFLFCGRNYQHGIGVEANPGKAIGFYRKSIKADRLLTIRELVELGQKHPDYELIPGTSLDELKKQAYAEAVSIAERAPNFAGYRKPLAAIYFLKNGIGGPANPELANRMQPKVNRLLLNLIEKEEHPYSLFHHGCYLISLGDAASSEEGTAMLKKAAEKNFVPAKTWLTKQQN